MMLALNSCHSAHFFEREGADFRDVAQPGSALAWGASGRRFKSGRPDQ
jgi:hypothetical protein